MKEYIGTPDFCNGMTVEMTGLIIEIFLLSLLVPLIIWIFNYRENRLKKYHGVSILFGLFNTTLDQIALLFDFDKIKFEKDGHLNSEDIDAVLKYFFKNVNELKISYVKNFYYGNLEPKLFCIEHYCNNNKEISKDLSKVLKIIDSLNKSITDFEKIQFLEIKNKKLQIEISATKSFIFALCESIKEFNEKKVENEKLIEIIHNLTLLMMSLFYKYVRFFENFHFYHKLKIEVLKIDYSNQRDNIMRKIYKKEEKNKNKGQFWSELFMLIRIIKRRLKYGG